MKKNKITTAVVAGFAGVSGISSVSMSINPDVSFIYSINSLNPAVSFSYFHVETPNQHNAVKVRFIEGENSNNVFDFYLYLFPYDVFSPSLYTTNICRTSQGHIEVLEMSASIPINAPNTFSFSKHSIPLENYYVTDLYVNVESVDDDVGWSEVKQPVSLFMSDENLRLFGAFSSNKCICLLDLTYPIDINGYNKWFFESISNNIGSKQSNFHNENDLVVTFPTKRPYVDSILSGS